MPDSMRRKCSSALSPITFQPALLWVSLTSLHEKLWGICESVDWCNQNDGEHIAGYCAGPTNIECCLWPVCEPEIGHCQYTGTECAGTFVS